MITLRHPFTSFPTANTKLLERCITTHESNTIRHKSNTIRHKSNTIRRESNTIRHESNTIRHESNTIRHESNTIRRESNTIRHESNTIGHERCNISQKTSIYIEKVTIIGWNTIKFSSFYSTSAHKSLAVAPQITPFL